MPRSVRGLGESRPSQRSLLQQQSYNFTEHPSVVESRAPAKTTLDADSLIRTCEAWACEAFRLPGDFLLSLAQPAKKKRQVFSCDESTTDRCVLRLGWLSRRICMTGYVGVCFTAVLYSTSVLYAIHERYTYDTAAAAAAVSQALGVSHWCLVHNRAALPETGQKQQQPKTNKQRMKWSWTGNKK